MPIRNRYHRALTPYLQRSRAARKAAYRHVDRLIRRAAPVLGGSSYTRQVMHGENAWLDLYFLGGRSTIIYNATLQTTRHAYKEEVVDMAFARLEQLVPQSETWWESGQQDVQTGTYLTPVRVPKRYAQLGGLGPYEWIEAQLKPIADEKCVQVHEHWVVRSDCHHGIGLDATLDVPHLTAEVVQEFVERFLRRPHNHHDPRLLAYASDEISDWGIEANAVAEPWEWHAGEGD